MRFLLRDTSKPYPYYVAEASVEEVAGIGDRLLLNWTTSFTSARRFYSFKEADLMRQMLARKSFEVSMVPVDA